MANRIKFISLTLINWNGFFFRTFELNEVVTTLSGGNGAGKSTTMAAFITALVPDLSLLYFRNTTETSSMGGSRDRGLYGKLKPGPCYALIQGGQAGVPTLLVGVCLQQLKGRDKKVDLKPFMITGLADSSALHTIFSEQTGVDKQVRVRDLAVLKQVVGMREGCQFTSFGSITDYHGALFEGGLLPKRLRTFADRSKFYRLIEASMYGGISAPITHALHAYLLPENGSVKQAFEDMERAVVDNRRTLEAIKATEQDRRLFKQLLTDTTDYVTSDFMRWCNVRSMDVSQLLQLRQEKQRARSDYELWLGEHAALLKAYESLQQVSIELDQCLVKQKARLNHLQQCAQEKASRLCQQGKLALLSEHKAVLQQKFAEAVAEKKVADGLQQACDKEVEQLRAALFDYQSGLTCIQTRALQYQQACRLLERAQAVSDNPQLTMEELGDLTQLQLTELQALTERRAAIAQKLQLTRLQKAQAAIALRALETILEEVIAPEFAFERAQLALQEAYKKRLVASESGHWQRVLRSLAVQCQQQKNAVKRFERLKTFPLLQGNSLLAHSDIQGLSGYLGQKRTTLTDEHRATVNRRLALDHQVKTLQKQVHECEQAVPKWAEAQHALKLLQTHVQEGLSDPEAVMYYLERLNETAEQHRRNGEQLLAECRAMEKTIATIHCSQGAYHEVWAALCNALGGVLLSDYYETIPMDMAASISAVYGPLCNGIIVSDVAKALELLQAAASKLLPEDPVFNDIYLVESDQKKVDEAIFPEVMHQAGAVLVKLSERQWRYSRYVKPPLLGSSAREAESDRLRAKLDQLRLEAHEQSLLLARILHQKKACQHFITHELSTAFQADPEQRRTELQKEFEALFHSQQRLLREEKEQADALQSLKEPMTIVEALLPHSELLQQNDVYSQYEAAVGRSAEAERAKQYVKRHEKSLQLLEKNLNALSIVAINEAALVEAMDQAEQEQQKIQEKFFIFNELLQCRDHFQYACAAEEWGSQEAMNTTLRHSLGKALERRDQVQLQRQSAQEAVEAAAVELAGLESRVETIQTLLVPLLKLWSDEHESVNEEQILAVEKAYKGYSDEKEQITAQGLLVQQNIARSEIGIEKQQAEYTVAEKNYQQARLLYASSQKTWRQLVHRSKQMGLEARLYKAEWRYLSADRLRSNGDKALGSLRQSLAELGDLRDLLSRSEDPKRPERKLEFYEAVHRYLCSRIRRDIFQTENPIEAITQMEIELERLKEELVSREKILSINTKSVSGILRKTILREQQRIQQLNDGLQSVAFGQIQQIRLKVTLRPTYLALLEALSDASNTHHDLFSNSSLTFSEAMAALYARLTLDRTINGSQRQAIGISLLDYRNYLDLDVEVFRGSEGWIRAQSGALSTGESIGIGTAVLLMVMQSWESEAIRFKGKVHLPCRLLFLDEAARLDERSITTLFELAERLQMQLLIAAPENIHPEKGTTYKLVRHLIQGEEQVHVVGLKDFDRRVAAASAPMRGSEEAVLLDAS